MSIPQAEIETLYNEKHYATKQSKLPVRVPQGGHVEANTATFTYTVFEAVGNVDLKFQAINNSPFITILEC